MSNSIGTILKLSSFGESHGPAIGGVIEGVPARLHLDIDAIQSWLDRRRPGQSTVTTPRKEADKIKFLSGLSPENITLGSPLAFVVENKNTKPQDYSFAAKSWRPSHADYAYEQKYQQPIATGGGRASARETIARVVAGAISKQILVKNNSINSCAYTCAIGAVSIKEDQLRQLAEQDLDWYSQKQVESSLVKCPLPEASGLMVEAVQQAKHDGDSLGGQVLVRMRGVPTGLGEPVFDKLEALLGRAMLSLPAAKGFEIGSGFSGTKLKGSEHNDLVEGVYQETKKAHFASNRSGGVQAGVSNGAEIYFFVGFKPTSTIGKVQQTTDKSGSTIELAPAGRHDPCVVPRAVVICEAMAWHVLADLYLRHKAAQP